MSESSSTVRRTFLFTDIEGSTRLWDQFPDAMLSALDQHDALLGEAIVCAGGHVMLRSGDGVVAVFCSAAAAVDAAIAAQRALAVADFGPLTSLKVRMGVHSGEVVDRDGELLGWALNVASRLHALAHGGQIVVSGASQPEAEHGLAERVAFVDLGMHRLRDVAAPIRVFSVMAEGLDAFDDLRGTARPVPSVPRPLTTFVGRTIEIERIRAQLFAHQLVTLVGLAGVGKTRLALEVASREADRFAGGVVVCEFSGALPSQVGAALGKALGVERRSLHSSEESVVEWLHDKELLLVLDNCEDALESVGELALAVSRFAPACRMLATSREPLSVSGEHVTLLQPLDTDADTDDSVVLFLERARAAGAELVDDVRTRALAREVCDAVAGVPLAIELAASNASSLSLLDIADAVRAGELPTSSRTGGSHRSVDDAIDLTFNRLDPNLRDAFLRCSVLTGSFDRDAFAAVVLSDLDNPSLLELLRGLVDRSLVVAETRMERTRFRLLEPIRAYAEARLDPSDRNTVQAAFVDHYVGVAMAAADRLRGPDEARCVSQIELDFDNFRAAQARAIAAGNADAALRIVAALWDYAFMRMRSEIFDWGEAAASAAPSDHPSLSMVLGIVALGGWIRESPAKSAHFAAESLRLEQEHRAPRSLPVRLALLNSAEYSSATTDMRNVMSEVITLSNESANPYWQTNVDVVRSLGHSFAGRGGPAVELANRALAKARESENPSTIAWALFGRAVATELFDVEHAEALLDDCLVRARSVDNRWIEAMCSTRLASLRRRSGAVLDAITMVLELLDTWERAGHRSHVWSAVRQAALCLADAGDPTTAVILNQAAAAAQLALPQLPADAEDLASALHKIRLDFGEDQMRRWAARADGLDQADAVRVARERLQLMIAG
jgi:predicted ATPase/class 3 adenylate cyclase